MRGLLAFCFVRLAFAQSFEAASIEISPHSTARFARGGGLRGARYDLKNATMVDLISSAAVSDWDSVRPMLRTLLADRFKLTTHLEDTTLWSP